MSRKQTSSQRMHQVVDYDLITEESAGEDRRRNNEKSCLNEVTSCTSRLWSCMNREFNKLFDERSDKFTKAIPSIVSFVFGLIVVRVYGETIDREMWRCLHSLSDALASFYKIVSRLDARDFENILSVGLIVLFWLGAARVVANIARKIIDTPKHCCYSENDY